MKQSNTFKLRLSDMNIKYILYTFVFSACFFHIASAQEIKYNVSVNTPTLQMADPAVFKSFEKSVNEFLNNQRWTDLEVKEEEIKNFFEIKISSMLDPNIHSANILKRICENPPCIN